MLGLLLLWVLLSSVCCRGSWGLEKPDNLLKVTTPKWELSSDLSAFGIRVLSHCTPSTSLSHCQERQKGRRWERDTREGSQVREDNYSNKAHGMSKAARLYSWKDLCSNPGAEEWTLVAGSTLNTVKWSALSRPVCNLTNFSVYLKTSWIHNISPHNDDLITNPKTHLRQTWAHLTLLPSTWISE